MKFRYSIFILFPCHHFIIFPTLINNYNLLQSSLFEWSEATQGLILSSFYYGYVLTHIPGGMMAERFGGKWVLGLGLLSTAFCTTITPIAVKSGGATALFILRVVEGLGEVMILILPLYYIIIYDLIHFIIVFDFQIHN